jgi:hypothetical protein
MSFGVSDKEIAVTIERMEGGNKVQSILMSNESHYVKHFASIFEELWRNGIDASDRIRNVEEGVDLAEVEVIENPKESIKSCNQDFHFFKGRIISFIFYSKLIPPSNPSGSGWQTQRICKT